MGKSYTDNSAELDVLDTFPTLKVAVAYKDPQTGEELDYFPADLGFLEKCEVVYKELEGWQTSTTAVKKFVGHHQMFTQAVSAG